MWWPGSKTAGHVGVAQMASLAARLAVFFQAGLSPAKAWEELALDSHIGEAGQALAGRIVSQLHEGGRHAESVRVACEGQGEPERVFSAVVAVADESGTPLYHALWALAEALRDRVSVEAEIRAIVQAPRQTTLLLLALPPLSLVVAGLLGVNALGFLTGSAFGWSLLVLAVLLYAAAIVWMGRLVSQLMPDAGYLSPARDLLAVASQGGALPEVAEARVNRVLIEHGLAESDNSDIGDLTALSRRVGIPISRLSVAEATWQRHHARAEAAEAAQSLSVRILIPLGLFILPAFVAVGVVPVIFTLLEGALRTDQPGLW